MDPTLQDEYELWKKNCRYMYEYVSENTLTWPLLTVQWLPQNTDILLATQTLGAEANSLRVALMKWGTQPSDIQIGKDIRTSGEVNRARYKPLDPTIAAAIDGDGCVQIHSLAELQQIHSIKAHTENGFGLAWHPTAGRLVSGADDCSVAIVDVETQTFEKIAHKAIVNDVRWVDPHVFGSVSDDERLLLFDLRQKMEPVFEFTAQKSNGVNCLAISPFSQHLAVLGGASSNLLLVDLRSGALLHTMMGHGELVTCMEFSPHADGIVASGSTDRRVILWDLKKIGEEQAQEDAEDGCPEIYMIHAGHTDAVNDLLWCQSREWTLASVSQDNILHLWEVGKKLREEKIEPRDVE